MLSPRLLKYVLLLPGDCILQDSRVENTRACVDTLSLSNFHGHRIAVDVRSSPIRSAASTNFQVLDFRRAHSGKMFLRTWAPCLKILKPSP